MAQRRNTGGGQGLRLENFKVYVTGMKVVAEVHLKEGNVPLAGTSVEFKINANKFSAVTDADGCAKHDFGDQRVSGDYTISVRYFESGTGREVKQEAVRRVGAAAGSTGTAAKVAYLEAYAVPEIGSLGTFAIHVVVYDADHKPAQRAYVQADNVVPGNNGPAPDGYYSRLTINGVVHFPAITITSTEKQRKISISVPTLKIQESIVLYFVENS